MKTLQLLVSVVFACVLFITPVWGDNHFVIDSAPPHAQLFINGQSSGMTPYQSKFPLDVTLHIQITKDGYYPVNQLIKLSSDKSNIFTFTLISESQPLPALKKKEKEKRILVLPMVAIGMEAKDIIIMTETLRDSVYEAACCPILGQDVDDFIKRRPEFHNCITIQCAKHAGAAFQADEVIYGVVKKKPPYFHFALFRIDMTDSLPNKRVGKRCSMSLNELIRTIVDSVNTLFSEKSVPADTLTQPAQIPLTAQLKDDLSIQAFNKACEVNSRAAWQFFLQMFPDTSPIEKARKNLDQLDYQAERKKSSPEPPLESEMKPEKDKTKVIVGVILALGVVIALIL
ncbi:hypothetical protein ACFL27_12345 [candidate division CSSED10-310 bacterium]|uniref:PEGA domain-containing protein n=1 Tax=candidate division CSSED10-310 bacterium TaxID=2855610 RepID=A0ABV6YXQ9_UNCC1